MEVIERQPNFNRSDVLFEVLQHPRARYWTDPRLLSQQPSERDLSRRGLLPFCNLAKQI
jgi:hypothetical protein